ncbi:MAG: hypothetical protein NDF55_03905 [archaeon GB-1867-005]|nr:hypothetical protein [Candidatus Culexmicrobium cathedralense]
MIEDIQDKLRTYFASEGYIENPIEEFSEQYKPDMAFRRSRETLFVYIMDLSSLSSKSALLKKIMRMVAAKKHCNLIYAAVPKIIATTLDSAALEEHGIGMLIVDDDVREVLPAKYNEMEERSAEVEEVARKISELEAKISRLERAIANMEVAISRIEFSQPQQNIIGVIDRISDLERELSKVRDEILLINRRLNKLEEKVLKAPKAKKPPPPIKAPQASFEIKKVAEELPSFFKDNPWVSILSSRGKSVEEG